MMTPVQQTLICKARLLHGFMRQKQIGTCLREAIQRFTDNPTKTTERALRLEVSEQIAFLKSISRVYPDYDEWLQLQRQVEP